MMTFDDPRGDDPDHARVPVRTGQHVGAPARPLGLELAHLGLGLPLDALLDGTALGVDLVELRRDRLGAHRVLAEHQLHPGIGAGQPARRVDPRRQAEAERARVQRARVGPGDRDQRPHAGSRGDRHRPQPVADEPTVLTGQRDEVGDGRQRDELEIVLGGRGAERERELVRDTRAAQVRARVPADRGVHDRAVRQPSVGPRRVMVGDHDVDPGGPGGGDLLDRGDRAVDRDQQLGPLLRQSLHGVRRQAVAVLDPAGHEPVDDGAERAQGPDHDRRRADAVDVVVAVDGDPAARRDGGEDQLAGLVDPRERRRIVRLAGLEEGPHLRGLGQAAADEHLGQHVPDPELALERERRRQLIGCDREPRLGPLRGGRGLVELRGIGDGHGVTVRLRPDGPDRGMSAHHAEIRPTRDHGAHGFR